MRRLLSFTNIATLKAFLYDGGSRFSGTLVPMYQINQRPTALPYNHELKCIFMFERRLRVFDHSMTLIFFKRTFSST
jgi:hypothetical protein